MREALVGQASVAHSQPYYLDITRPTLIKETFVDPLLRRLVVPPMAVAALGDMENDLAMFGKVGRSIAMGNANAEERQANYVTASNADDGFARTIERYILDYQENEGIT
jgi:hydroxymethylpyrimidine pyrophosphatase-like HAD family hydrolase